MACVDYVLKKTACVLLEIGLLMDGTLKDMSLMIKWM